MDRIGHAFQQASETGRSCFVAYLCAGDPNFETSSQICRLVIEGGIDILELGIPFSDPLADGLTNQLAAQRALTSGFTPPQVCALVEDIRTYSQCPVVVYTYYNLLSAGGVATVVGQLRDAGVDGILALDLPPEEACELLDASRNVGMKNIFIVAPTTGRERVRRIVADASGFIYFVSREGVTGERVTLEGRIREAVTTIREESDIPVVVGFGISTPEHGREVASMADGVVVGSALVNCIGRNPDDKRLAME